MTATSIPRDLAGTFVVLFRLFFCPASTNRAVVYRSRWWVPLVLVGALQMIGAAVWLHNTDPFAIIAGDGTFPVTFESTEADFAQRLRIMLLSGQVLRWIVISPLVTISVGAVCYVSLSLFIGVPPLLAKCVSVVTHAFCAGDLARLLLGLVVSTATADWRVAPIDAAGTDLSFLLDPPARAQALGRLLDALDMLTFWKLWILSVGLSVASGISTRKAAFLVATGWLVYALSRAWIVRV